MKGVVERLLVKPLTWIVTHFFLSVLLCRTFKISAVARSTRQLVLLPFTLYYPKRIILETCRIWLAGY
jgi:hypothetical protein